MSATALPKLIAGSLLVGVSALGGTSLLAAVAGGIGVNWASEALGGVLPASLPPLQPDSPLTAAYERALRRAVSELRRRYQDEYGRRADVSAFALVAGCATSVAEAQAPAGADLAASQEALAGALDALLHDHEQRQVAFLKARLLEQAALSFQEELAADDRAWRLFHGWLMQSAAQHGAMLRQAVADLPRVLAQAQDQDAAHAAIEDATDRLDVMLDALRDELRGIAAAAPPLKIQTGGVDMGNAQIGQMGDIVAGDKHEHHYYGDPDSAVSADEVIGAYLAEVIGSASHLTLAEVGNADPDQREVLLEDVYTRLEVASTFPLRTEPSRDEPQRLVLKDKRQATAMEALAHHGRLVLLGAPGSGKSTFARFLALCLARATRGDGGWLDRLGEGWASGALLPVRVELAALAEWLRDREGGAALLWAYVAEQVGQPALAATLQARTRAGTALLILDGLDEVPAEALGRIQHLLAALAAAPEPRHILVTCRMLDYEEEARRIPGWSSETLIPFSDSLQQEFIGRWYDTLGRLRRTLSAEPALLRNRLRRAVRERPDLRRLAGTPLLLTMMALLNGARAELPEKRVELYAQCLDLLLREWRFRPGRPSLEARLALPDWRREDTDRLLNHLGYAAHRQEGPADDAADAAREGGAVLTRDALVLTAAQVFKRYGADNPYEPAGRFCDYIGRHSNGVLQHHGGDAYRFPHRTFQEFLAARRLVDDRDWEGGERDKVLRLRSHALSAQWHEVLLLAVSLLIVQGQALSVASLAAKLTDGQRRATRVWAERAVVAAEVLAEAERKHLDGVGEGRLWDAAVKSLVVVLTPAQTAKKPLLDAVWRVRAGAALGRLGDPRPGVCDLRIDWCEVAAGPFLFGSAESDERARSNEKPQRTVDLPGFRISRYPVTNAQWRLFLKVGGYAERRWWSEAGWQAKKQRGWTQPRYWDEPRFSGPNQPVVGISWYEANAFCCWLSAQLGCEVRLPSEAEWEKAARGTDGRIYPWGNEWDSERANTDEGGAGVTSPVGCYPNGTSPCVALDMIGNVLEWTATPWTSNRQQSDGTTRETEDGERFVWRGGSWADDQRDARCACRINNRPSVRSDDLGLRVVAALTLGWA